jgi:hypothetical protein
VEIKKRIKSLSLSLFFLAEVCRPFEFARVSAEIQGTFSAFARAEPQD